MDEKTQRLIEKNQATFRQIAESQAPVALAEALLTLLKTRPTVDAQTLIAQLLDSTAHLKPTDLTRLQHEAAAKLLGWSPAPASG